MMKSELEFGNEDDRLLRQLLNDAYDSMGPSDEAMERMFAGISEFASASRPETASETIEMPASAKISATASTSPSQTVIPAFQPAPRSGARRISATIIPYGAIKKRKSRFTIPVIGSIAACLVVLAGIGALITTNYRLPGAPDEVPGDMFATVDDLDSEAPDKVVNPSGQAAQPTPANPNVQAPAQDLNAQPQPQTNTAPETPNSGQSQETPAPAATAPEPTVPETTPEPSITPAASVVTDDGAQLVLARSDNDSVVEADSSLVSSEVSLGVVNDEANPGVTCIIYKYDGDEAEYAIQIEGSSGYYLADALPETGSIANDGIAAPPISADDDENEEQQLGQAVDMEDADDPEIIDTPEEIRVIE